MPRGHEVFESVPRGISVTMLARDTDPSFARYAAAIGAIIFRMDVEERGLTEAVLQIVGMNVDHQHYPSALARRFSHHVEHKPIAGRRTIKKFRC
jgi:hypothetical protein